MDDNPFLRAVLVDGCPENYNKWANKYDSDLKAMGYVGPNSVSAKWLSYHAKALEPGRAAEHKVFDAGCGTGFVGECLIALVSSQANIEIHGGDLSPDMLEVAQSKNVYSDLKVVNLKAELPYRAESFDSIVSSGAFTQNHCGPECLPHLIRILKKGCYLITTVRKDVYEETKMEWARQIQECNCQLIEDDEVPYCDEVKGVVLVIHKLATV